MCGDTFDDEKPQKKKQDLESLAVQNFMKFEAGRDFMWKHLQLCGVFENIFDTDTIKHAYNAGKRQAGLQLDSDLKEYAPASYMKMIEENLDG
jgi:hypothetical protein